MTVLSFFKKIKKILKNFKKHKTKRIFESPITQNGQRKEKSDILNIYIKGAKKWKTLTTATEI